MKNQFALKATAPGENQASQQPAPQVQNDSSVAKEVEAKKPAEQNVESSAPVEKNTNQQTQQRALDPRIQAAAELVENKEHLPVNEQKSAEQPAPEASEAPKQEEQTPETQVQTPEPNTEDSEPVAATENSETTDPAELAETKSETVPSVESEAPEPIAEKAQEEVSEKKARNRSRRSPRHQRAAGQQRKQNRENKVSNEAPIIPARDLSGSAFSPMTKASAVERQTPFQAFNVASGESRLTFVKDEQTAGYANARSRSFAEMTKCD